MISKLKENRVLRSYLGGKRIDRFLGKDGEDSFYPEDWTASVVTALNPGSTKVDEGYGYLEDGRKVKDVVKKEMRCLVKLLDASERLVIQVHPTKDYALKYFNSKYGKTECWYFLDCEKGACVYLGFKKGITEKAWKEVFDNQDIESMLSMLNKVPVKKGDCVFVNGGEPHAIGTGCFMIETQEPSDLMGVTERITPSGKVLSDQKMHSGVGFSNMLKMFTYIGYSLKEVTKKYKSTPKKIDKNIDSLIDERFTDKFKVIRLKKDAIYNEYLSNCVMIVSSGLGSVNGIDVKKGDRLFVDDCKELKINGDSDFEVVICY